MREPFVKASRLPSTIASLLILGFVIRLAIAWAPIEWLLRYVLADDSFYYFTIARNLSHGNGFSFDTIAETNGFHPLWMVPLVLIYSLVEEQILAVHVALTVSAFLEVGSVLLLYNMLCEMGTTRFLRTVAVGLYALSPILLSNAGPMNGMETSLNVLVMFGFLRQYWKMVSRGDFSGRSLFSVGFLAGLLLLARTDNIVLVSVSCMFLPLLVRSKSKEALLSLQTIFLTAFIVVSPWALWSLLKFGTLIQVSGVSVPFMIRAELNEQGWASTDYLVQFIKNLANTVTFFPVRLIDTRILSFPGVMVAAMVLVFTVALIRRSRTQNGPERNTAENLCRVLLVSAVLFVLAHTLRAVYMRGWYYMSLYPILLLCGATLARNFFEGVSRRNLQRLTILFLGIIAVISLRGLFAPRQGEMDKFRMARVMNSVLHEGVRVGSGNAGVYGYFFEKGIVVDLDGLVNNTAYESIRARDLEGYCSTVGITHLVDPIAGFERMAKYWNAEQTSPLSVLKIIHKEPGRTSADSIGLGQLISPEPP